jgi:hypothetical protein
MSISPCGYGIATAAAAEGACFRRRLWHAVGLDTTSPPKHPASANLLVKGLEPSGDGHPAQQHGLLRGLRRRLRQQPQ